MKSHPNLFVLNNQNLFSNNYLENRLPTTTLWNAQKEHAAIAFEEIKKAYDSIKTLYLGPGEEAGLEDKFIRPVLKALGYEWDVQPKSKHGMRKERPDYALFKDHESFEAARKVSFNGERYYSHALTILEAKYWGRRLNDTDPNDLDHRDPTAQTVRYLDSVYDVTNSRIQWAMLTNGKRWRLFYYRASSRSGNFFEIDLEEIILRNDVGTFLYFYLFFAKDAFIPDAATGKTWLEQHLKETEEYASRVSDNLKNLIFDHIFEGLATGFIEYRSRELGIAEETDESLKEIFNGCLTLLYRLLFLLYAESRGLLPVNDHDRYYKKSLKKIKEDIRDELKKSGFEGMSHNAYDYWSRLESLFRIIDKGDKALNVPIYNGGLFETPYDGFLCKNKIADPYIAEAIEKLTVDQDAGHAPGVTPFIDYSSLNVRHLGDIYEGLLEFHVRVADDEMVEIREKGKSFWKERSEVKAPARTYRTKKRGEIYIENSKHERKASGSYYTPHYIVEYIVGNTVGPVLTEKLNRTESLLDELDRLYAKQRKQLNKPKEWKHWEHPGEPKSKHIDEIIQKENEIFEVLFDIKVLDPAMGSGHFLVHTVDFISDKIITFLAKYPDNPILRRIDELRNEIVSNIREQKVAIDESRLTEVNLIKRMVMKRCIYGVDLNAMAVELAKLSLWLDSFTLGAPLSFLDHHLKCGNSLIGTSIEELEKALSGHLFGINLEPLKRALRDMIFVSELPDATVAQVKESYRKYGEANKGLYGYKILLDMLIVEHFGIPDAKKFLISDFDKIDLNRLHDSLASLPATDRKVIRQVETLAGEKRFYHWEIEFPEVFYERTASGQQIVKQDNPGFDCVIGNPPYDVLSELEQERNVEPEKKFFASSAMYQPAVGGKLNFYRLFIALSIALLKKDGRQGFIVPMALLADKQAKPLREYILKENCFDQIEAFPQKDNPDNRVFQDAKLSTCAYSLLKDNHADFSVRIHSGKYIEEKSTMITLTPTLIEVFDQDNLSIPSYPNMTSHDFNLALKLMKISEKRMLGDYAPSQQGEVNLTTHSEFLTVDKKGQVVLRGAHINRYEFQDEPKQGEPMYLNVQKFLSAHRDGSKAYDHKYLRIGYQRGAAIDNWRRIIATVIDKGSFCSDTVNYIVQSQKYNLFAVLALLNSALWEWRFRLTSTNNHVNSYEIDAMPLPPISFTTPDKERKKRVDEAIALYQDYMVDLEKGKAYEERGDPEEHSRPVAHKSLSGRKEGAVHGKHTGAGKRVHGFRRRARKPEDAERISEDSEEYRSTTRYTRYIESSLGIKTYTELAPALAKGVERVMASLLEKSPDELKVTPELVCKLHKDAFEELFPSWAGRYRDRDVKVGDYAAPPYYEVPVLMRSYCDDLEFRLSALPATPPVNEMLLEALAFAEGRLLSIHPFLDFNGRVTRMLLFALLYRFDLPPVQLVPDDKNRAEKDAYLNALSEADRMNWQPLVAVWRKRLSTGEGK